MPIEPAKEPAEEPAEEKQKRIYTPPQVSSRKWMEEKMSVDAWRDVLEMSDAFAFIFDGVAEVWPARHRCEVTR